jgi:hypothetical protein
MRSVAVRLDECHSVQHCEEKLFTKHCSPAYCSSKAVYAELKVLHVYCTTQYVDYKCHMYMQSTVVAAAAIMLHFNFLQRMN